jgi:hypothetical protein
VSRLKEQRAWDSFKESHDSTKLKLERVENQIRDAMPDVVGQNRRGASFWLEFKAIDKWPVRNTTPVMRNCFEPGQLPWLRSWCQWGGHAFVILRAQTRDWLLLNPLDDKLLEHGRADLVRSAIFCGKCGIIDYLERLK